MIQIAISTDRGGYEISATLVASILRRASRPVWVRCWCRGFLPESFEVGQLRMEFLPAEEEVRGKYPAMSGPAAYDRLRVIRDCPDWDRCVVMDYDQLALCDLAPLMDLEMGDHLLAAHLQGAGVDIAYAMRVWLKQPIPEGWEHVAGHPYFLMPPVMNLKGMREAGTWEKFVAAHAAFGADEQLSLTAATEGRTLALEKKWNLFPKLHIREGEVPVGVVHWCGWPKPWHKGAKVWRPDIWEAERTSWEHLRMGIWNKPAAVVVEPEDGGVVRGLARRGWRVVVVKQSFEGMPPSERRIDATDMDFPDVTKASMAEFCQEKDALEGVDFVRFSSDSVALEWLQAAARRPDDLVVGGPVPADAMKRFRGLGYGGEFRMKPADWPNGGPSARVLEHQWGLPMPDVGPDEAVYLTRREAAKISRRTGPVRRGERT